MAGGILRRTTLEEPDRAARGQLGDQGVEAGVKILLLEAVERAP